MTRQKSNASDFLYSFSLEEELVYIWMVKFMNILIIRFTN